MKNKQFLIYLNLYFLYIITGKSYCKDIYVDECEKNPDNLINNYINSYLSPDPPLDDYNNLDYRTNSKFYPQEEKETITPGKVQSILLFKEKVYILNVDSSNKEKDLIIYFYPLDCEIQIIGERKDMEIEKISNYEFNAFYTIIKKENLNQSNTIIMNTLINTKDENKKNRTFHLIINSFEYSNNPNLTIKEKEPTFLTFNNTINKVNLIYNLINNDISSENPISISFFIKERIKFVIRVYDDSKELYKKTVGYLDRILIDRKSISKTSSYINISIEKIEGKDADMVVKVVEDYQTPIYFHKNILNIGFIPSNVPYQYYYMEIFEGEHGEIILNNKRYNGILISKLIPKKDNDDIFKDKKYYPNEKETNILEYNEYSQKIIFDSSNTNICADGCYLLITYFSNYINEIDNKKILGTEFTLLGRIFEQEEEFRTQIVNIPLNEYIFGSFESSSIKIHYYSLYIPEKGNILLEINLNFIGIYIKKGINRININSLHYLTKNYYGNNIYNITPKECGLDSFENEYITIALTTYLPINNSHYYFRILQKNSKNTHLIYPLDTNKANTCNTTLINGIYSCFFLVDNIYKDLYNDLIIYAYGYDYVNYTAWFIEEYENEIYSINLENLNYKSKGYDNIYLKIDKNIYVNKTKYILINIHSDKEETLTVLSNFYDNKTFFPTIQIYSYQLIYLYDNENLNFNFNKITQKKYRIEINNTYGNGEIKFDIEEYNGLMSGDRTLSYVITKELNNIDIYNNKDNNKRDNNELLFNIKIVYELDSDIIEELYFDKYYNLMQKTFPIKFFLKEIEYNGSDINFYFHFNFSLNNISLKKDDIIIKGYAIKYDLMKLITDRLVSPINFGEEIYGQFDNRTNQGLMVFEKAGDYHYDYYYYIEISNSNEKIIQPNITMDIYASSKNTDSVSMPLNKYIRGSFDLNNEQEKYQRYYINDAQNSQDYIIEFSSNYKYLDLKLSKSISDKGIKVNGGIKKYFISFNTSNPELNYFDIEITKNIPKNEKNYWQKANYLIIYYQKEKKINNYTTKLITKIGKNSSSIIIENKELQDSLDNYTITCIANIFEKKRILKDELINTTSPFDSEIVFTKTDIIEKSNQNFSIDLNGFKMDNNYEGALFIILENNNKNLEEKISYYSFPFGVEEDSDNNLLKMIIIISSVSVVIIIIIIIFIMRYRKVIKKNKDLEKKVNEISFADKDHPSKEDEDNIVTFV